MENSFVRKFIFDKLPICGAYVDLSDVWQTIVGQKEYSDGLKRLLGELLAVNVLITSNMKFEGKMSIQIQGNSAVSLVVSECSHDMHVRATVKYENNPQHEKQISYTDCIKDGNLVISIDSSNDGKFYQSVVKLVGDTLAQVMNEYMIQSEQLHTFFVLSYTKDRVVGFMLQQLPDPQELYNDGIERVFLLAKTLAVKELLQLDLEQILYRMFNEYDVVLFEPHKVVFRCSCSCEKVSNMLRGLGQEEVMSIIAKEGKIEVTCSFCNSICIFNEHDVQEIFNTLCVEIECISQEIN